MFQVLQNVEVEFAIPQSHRLYCPHKECSAVLMKAEPACPGVPAQCPQCKRCFCAECLFPASHQVGVGMVQYGMVYYAHQVRFGTNCSDFTAALCNELPYCLHSHIESLT